ncbi:unnamed protein product, partial [Iphiclides podalirius]
MAYLRDKLPRYDVDINYVFPIPHTGCSSTPARFNYSPILVDPLFGGGLWCDLFCDDDDDVSTTSTSTSTEDYLDIFDVCSGCPTRRPSTVRPSRNNMPPLNLMIPPMNGMGVSVSNSNGSWSMSLIPWGSSPATTAPTPSATTAAATTAGTGGTTAGTTTAKA